jgi:hypothetical protein
MRAHSLFTTLSLGREDVGVLVAAYKDALRGLGIGPSESRLKNAVATKAIEIWQSGVRDRAELVDRILEEFFCLR